MTRPEFEIKILRGLIDPTLIVQLQNTLKQLLVVSGANGEDIDDCIINLAHRDRSALGAIYDVFRETRCFHELIGCDSLIAAVREILGTNDIHCPFHHTVFRMDLPTEEWRGFGWHQDLPYNVLSSSAVTIWTPVLPSGRFNGSINVAEGMSDRIYPVEIRRKRNDDGVIIGGRDAFIAHRFNSQFELDSVTLELEPGDVAIFGSLVVHRSGRNPGPKPRVSIQARFGELFSSDMISRRWENRRADGFHTFKSLHPELVELEEE